MNKQDLVSAVAEASGLTKADAGKAVEATFEAITGALKSGAKYVSLVSVPLALQSVRHRPDVTHAPVSQ